MQYFMDKMRDFFDGARDLWDNRDSIWDEVVDTTKDTPEKWRSSNSDKKIQIAVIVGICIICIAMFAF